MGELLKAVSWSVVVVGTMADLRSGQSAKALYPISLTDAGMVTCWREHLQKAYFLIAATDKGRGA